MNVVKRASSGLVALLLAGVSGMAMALPLDISATAGTIETDITHVVTTIGALLLVAAGLAVAYKWGKGALFS